MDLAEILACRKAVQMCTMLGTVYHAGKVVQKATVCVESHSSLVCSRGYAAAVYSMGMQQAGCSNYSFV